MSGLNVGNKMGRGYQARGDRPGCWRGRAGAFAVGLLLACSGFAAQGEDASTAGAIQTFNDVSSENAGKALIESALQGRQEGAKGFLAGKHLVELRLDEVSGLAKERNVALEAQRQNFYASRAVMTESESLFDPVVSAALRHTRYETYTRTASIGRLHAPTDAADYFEKLQIDGLRQSLIAAGQPAPVPAPTCITIDGERPFNQPSCQQQAIPLTQTEFASGESRPQFSWFADLGLTKPFRFGGSLNLQFESQFRHKDWYSFPSFFDSAFSRQSPIGIKNDRFPWSSFIGLTFTTPVPYAKNFGEFGSADVINIKLAGISSEQSDWQVSALSNQVQGALEAGYWQLVGALKQLQVTVAQRLILEQITASIRRQYDQQLITAYDMAQTEAQLDNIRSQEEIAWSNYVLASNAVAELLNYDPDTIVLPTGYSGAFNKDYTVEPETVRQTALDHRYELKISQADIDKSEIGLKFRENQMRPDISFTATTFLRQTDVAYGYSDWWDSVGQIFAPDSSEWFVGVAYRLPFGKNAEKSALSQARIQMEQAADAHAQTELTITQQVNSVLAQYLSTRAQMQLANQNMKLAELAYAKAERLKNLGLASQFEILRTLNTMLSARTGYIAAAVGYHQAYAQLEASQGLFN